MVNQMTHTPSTYVSQLSVTTSYTISSWVVLPMVTFSVLLMMVLKASCVSMQKVEMEMRMKNKEPNATYWREGEKKDKKGEEVSYKSV